MMQAVKRLYFIVGGKITLARGIHSGADRKPLFVRQSIHAAAP